MPIGDFSFRPVDIFRPVIDACEQAEPFAAAGMGGGMRLRLWAAAMLLCLSGPARAADWWWVGLNGNAPNRVLTYLDRQSIHQIAGGAVEAWLLAVGETQLPNGQQHQGTHYSFRCRQRSFSPISHITRHSIDSRDSRI